MFTLSDLIANWCSFSGVHFELIVNWCSLCLNWWSTGVHIVRVDHQLVFTLSKLMINWCSHCPSWSSTGVHFELIINWCSFWVDHQLVFTLSGLIGSQYSLLLSGLIGSHYSLLFCLVSELLHGVHLFLIATWCHPSNIMYGLLQDVHTWHIATPYREAYSKFGAAWLVEWITLIISKYF